MAFDYAEVYLEARAEFAVFGFDFVVVCEGQGELLLVYGCRCKECGFYALLEPVRAVRGYVAYLFRSFTCVGIAPGCSIAKSDEDYFFLVASYSCL